VAWLWILSNFPPSKPSSYPSPTPFAGVTGRGAGAGAFAPSRFHLRAQPEEWQDRVMEACSLKKNLEVMPFGDQTVTGERRVNVSGGQKQRIQIARAIYHDADIYLFDDPFSAVDVHTGSYLFKSYYGFFVVVECLLGFLASRTVVYVIHQVEFLPSADFILITLKEGLDHEENEKSDQINQKGQIVQEEERERRKIWSTNYSKVCSNYRITLKSPTSDDLEPHVSGSLPIYVYVALAVGSFASYLISTLLLVHVRCKTATMLFSKMHTCIFWASLSFFDSTPSGRILNKQCCNLARCLIMLVPQQHYISTSRDIARLIGVCEAPVIQHFAETISGLISVGSFGQEKGFVDTNYNLTYDLSRLEFHSAATMQ
ncbi:ABC transporter transmembrane region, partial [Musa troglodytarum]